MQNCFDLKSCSLGQLVKKNVFLVIITIIDDSKTHLFQKVIFSKSYLFKKLSFQEVIFSKSYLFQIIIFHIDYHKTIQSYKINLLDAFVVVVLFILLLLYEKKKNPLEVLSCLMIIIFVVFFLFFFFVFVVEISNQTKIIRTINAGHVLDRMKNSALKYKYPNLSKT
jgi:hypothetical protein